MDLGYYVVAVKEVNILNKDSKRPWVQVTFLPDDGLWEFTDDIYGEKVYALIESVLAKSSINVFDVKECKGKKCVAYLGKLPAINGFPPTLSAKKFFRKESFGCND